MATIIERQARGKSVYCVRIRRKGCPPLTATFERLTDARTWATRQEAALSEYRANPGSAARRHTLSEAIERYCREVLPGKARNTIAVQRPTLRWWDARLGPYRLCDIQPDHLSGARETLSRQFLPGTVIQYFNVLSHVFTTAVREWQWLEVNPVSRVRKPRQPKGRVRFLEREELTRLLAACQESPRPILSLIVHLALATAARKREILTLRWADVDLKRGHITLHQTKNGETRRVPVTGTALALLRSHARVRRLDTDLVFPGTRGSSLANITRAWYRAMRQASLVDFRFHDLRHTAASYLAMNGATLVELADILGHRTLSMVKRYSHLSERHTMDVLTRMTAAYLDTSAASS